MNRIILFSGGFDSTLALVDAIKSQEKEPDRGSVFALSVDIGNCSGTKVDREKASRNRILTYLKSIYYDVDIKDYTITVDMGTMPFHQSGLIQPMMWLPALFMSIPMNTDNIIIMSYILGDQAPVYKSEITAVLNLHKAMQNETKKEFTVKYPYEWIGKEEIILRLIREDKFLYENATTCEEHKDTKDNCGHCTPCQHLRRSLMYILSMDNVSDDDKNYIRMELTRRFGISCIIRKEEQNEDDNQSDKQLGVCNNSAQPASKESHNITGSDEV